MLRVSRSCITTCAVILLVVCVYVNLAYLPIISRHKTEQAESGVLLNDPPATKRLDQTNNLQPHKSLDKNKILDQLNRAKQQQQQQQEDHTQHQNHNKPVEPVKELVPPVVEPKLDPIDLKKIVSARIEVYLI